MHLLKLWKTGFKQIPTQNFLLAGWRSYHALVLNSICKDKYQNMKNYGEAGSKSSSIKHFPLGHFITVFTATYHATGVFDLLTAFRIVVTSLHAFSL